jgi:hypothetical protein
MYCPKCATQIVDNQRFCRNCGLKLDLIVDAVEGRRGGPIDFETLKRDIVDFGAGLRSSFEEAHNAIKHTRKLRKGQLNVGAPTPTHMSPQDWSSEISKAVWSHEFQKALKKTKVAHSRKYSLQQATLSIFGGGAMITVWFYLLEAATNSGLLNTLEATIADKTNAPIFGLVPVIQMLWMLGLIPIARGVAHLFNGIFLAPKAEKEPEPSIPNLSPNPIQAPPAYSPAVEAPATNELERERNLQPQMSITEDSTLRFEPK